MTAARVAVGGSAEHAPRHGATPGRTLEGDRSPWENRTSRAWQRVQGVTNSSTEQGPEVGRISVAGHPLARETASEDRSTDRRVARHAAPGTTRGKQATVTWHGCRRGHSSRGRASRGRMHPGLPRVSGSSPSHRGRVLWGPTRAGRAGCVEKRDEPRPASECNTSEPRVWRKPPWWTNHEGGT